jgi:integrase
MGRRMAFEVVRNPTPQVQDALAARGEPLTFWPRRDNPDEGAGDLSSAVKIVIDAAAIVRAAATRLDAALEVQRSRKRIVYTQAKNEHLNAVHMDIPLHPELERIINATPSGHLTFLVTAFGKPFTPAGFGNWFGDQCRAASVPGRAHGLRKATATRLAELGATPHMIQGLTGHRTLKEVEVYTRAANQKLLADSAMQKLINN